MKVRLITWNVASLKTRLPRLLDLLAELEPDVVCLQETKSRPERFPRWALAEAGYRADDHSGGRWNGVAILTRLAPGEDPIEPKSGIIAGLPGEHDPTQARWIETTYKGLRIASVYVVSGKSFGHPYYQAKLKFLSAMAHRVELLAAEGPLAILGDINICPTDADCWDTDQFSGSTHTAETARAGLRGILQAGNLVDAHVHYNGARTERGGTQYTWWGYRENHYESDYGLRIDHALVDRQTATQVHKVDVVREFREGYKPSDHVPLMLELEDAPTPTGGKAAPITTSGATPAETESAVR